MGALALGQPHGSLGAERSPHGRSVLVYNASRTATWDDEHVSSMAPRVWLRILGYKDTDHADVQTSSFPV